MIIFTRKNLNVVLLAAGLLLFAYAFYAKYQASRDKPDYSFAKEVITHSAANEETVGTATPEVGVDISSQLSATPRSPALTLAEYQELDRWDKTHGYFTQQEDQVYESYSEQTLKDLSAEGDVQAMLVLASYYLTKDYQPQEARNQLYKAAVFGATAALPALADRAQIEILRGESDKTPEGRQAGVTEIMAYYKVASMRGNPRASIPYINSFKKTYQRRYGEELVLTREQLNQIDQRAQEIYNELQENRRKLGLGDFDNSTPASVKKDYSLE